MTISRPYPSHDSYKMLAPLHVPRQRTANVQDSAPKSSIFSERATSLSPSLPPLHPSSFTPNTQFCSPPAQHQPCTYITSYPLRIQHPTPSSHLSISNTRQSPHPPLYNHKATKYSSQAADAIFISGIYHRATYRKSPGYMGRKTSNAQWRDSS